jgi:transcriptional regulator with PAS, ATPase and Fis domain
MRLTLGCDTGMIVESDAMRRVVARLHRVAPLDTTVLLSGESGTGKEIAARLLHDENPKRRSGPFVCMHSGAIPDTLLESELFGHVRGAFTGAERDHVGKFEQASGGTLFLDEISTMKPEAQVRLLRVLQERKVTRIGSAEARPVDVRVVVASNQSLKDLVDAGSFRLDLYYRVSTFPVSLPALRERPGDILPLVEHFSRCTAARLGLELPKQVSPEALRALSCYAWPGNVRQLENAVEYACIVSDERKTILPEDLPEEVYSVLKSTPSLPPGLVVTEQGLSFRTAVGNLERELILQSLRLAEGNKARAAELLDLKRTTFLEKLKRLEDEGMLGGMTEWPRALEA